MGAGLAKAAYYLAAKHHLAHAPTRLLVFMALTAIDTDANPWFQMNRARIGDEALGGGHNFPGRAIDRAVQPLLQAGLLRLTPAAPNRNAKYHLLDGNDHPLSVELSTGHQDERRSTSHDPTTNDVQRRTNERRSATQRATSSGTTNDVERRPQEEEENEKEEGGMPPAKPPRSCRRHPNGWHHDQPCAPCGRDRELHDKWSADIEAKWQDELKSRPRTLASLTAHERAQVDSYIRGFLTDLAPPLIPAAEQARIEREKEQTA